MEKLKPIRCRQCGKLFLCKGRYNLFHKLLPVPYSNCLDKIDCECENCHSPNKGNSICGNIDISYNPSSRESK
jgi:hypothetical protein